MAAYDIAIYIYIYTAEYVGYTYTKAKANLSSRLSSTAPRANTASCQFLEVVIGRRRCSWPRAQTLLPLIWTSYGLSSFMQPLLVESPASINKARVRNPRKRQMLAIRLEPCATRRSAWLGVASKRLWSSCFFCQFSS